jgi:hypothetical protein
MTEAHRQETWNHTAQILCMLNNVNASKRSQQKQPDAFHPMSRENTRIKPSPPLSKERQRKLLKKLFIKK